MTKGFDRRRLLALCMALVLSVSLLPLAANAAGETEVSTPAELEAAAGDPDVSAIKLTDSIILSQPLTISRTVTIDLNGKALSAKLDSGKLITVEIKENGNLTLKGGEGSKLISAVSTDPENRDDNYGVYLATKGKLTLDGSVKIEAGDETAYLIAMTSETTLTLKGKASLSGGAFGVNVLNGSSGYSISLQSTGPISSNGAMSNVSLTFAQMVPPFTAVKGDDVDVDLNTAPQAGVRTYTFAPIPTYTVTLPTGEGYTAAAQEGSASPAAVGTPYRFTVTVADGYRKTDGFAVTASAGTLTEDGGVYTISETAAGDNVSVSVAGVQRIPAYSVTLPTGEGYTAAAQEGSASPAAVGTPYRFTVTVADGYRKTDGFAVTASAGTLTEDGGVYTISGAADGDNVTVSVTGIEAIPTHAVTLTPGTGYTLTAVSASPVQDGGSFTFTFALAEGYRKGSGFAVKANGTALTGSGDSYTIDNITQPQTVEVTGVEPIPATYTVTLPTGTGYTVAGSSANPVTEGDSFSFTVSISSGYRKGDSFAVKANGAVLAESGGAYTIQNVTAAQTVTVEGVQAIPQITSTPATRDSVNTFTLNFTSSVTGDYYFIVTSAGSATPSVEAVMADANAVHDTCTAQTAVSKQYSLSGSDPAAKKLFLVVKADGVTNATPYSISIPACTYTVTLPTGTGYTAAAVAGSSSPVSAGGSYNFTVTIATGYRTGSNFAVKANGTALTAVNGVYTIPSINADQTVTVEGVEAASSTYTVTLPTGTGYTVAAVAGSSSPVVDGGSYNFTVTIANGYRKNASFAVKVNNAAISEVNGVYTISNIKENKTITVEGVEAIPVTYTVTLNSGTGYTVQAASGSTSPVAAGGSYSFTVAIASGYARNANFAVKANGVTLSPVSGIYTISNINANQSVTVTGVAAYQTTGGGTTTVPAAPSITTVTLTPATMGQAYSQQFAATGGTPITWSYTGNLPEGMSLSTTGLLSGTPTAEGSFRFALKASNSTGSSTKQLTLVVTGAEYTVTEGLNADWIQGTADGLTFQGSGEKSFTVRIDGSTVAEDKLSFSEDGRSVTIAPDYLESLATGTHTVTLIYPDGNAKARFSIKAQDRTVAPAVTAQPQSAEINEGEAVTFTVTASGTTPLLCQWQVDKNDGQGWNNITGAASASYTVAETSREQDGWQYRCVITNAAGSAESNAATLSIKEALGNVTANNANQRSGHTGRVILIIILVVAALGLAGGLYIYFRRRSDYMDE